LLAYVGFHLFLRHVVDREGFSRRFRIIRIGKFATLVKVQGVDRPRGKIRMIVIARNPEPEVHENGLWGGEFGILTYCARSIKELMAISGITYSKWIVAFWRLVISHGEERRVCGMSCWTVK
jgi:hypothetical protein